jgi:hypothetical protein
MQGENPITRFTGSSKYVLDEELAKIVNITMALEMPLLLKGEPGTGKTMLAHAIAEALNMRLIVLNVKSSMRGSPTVPTQRSASAHRCGRSILGPRLPGTRSREARRPILLLANSLFRRKPFKDTGDI